MQYPTETVEGSSTLVTQRFLSLIDRGNVKEAADEVGTPFIRSVFRSSSALREVMPLLPLTPDQLERTENSAMPVRYVEKEPDSTAITQSLMGVPVARHIQQPKFAVSFRQITSDRMVGNKWEFLTGRVDIRKILSDNLVLDCADQEDVGFRSMLLAGINMNPAAQRRVHPNLNATGFKAMIKALFRRRLPVGKLLLTNVLAADMIDLPAAAVGNAVAENFWKEGAQNSAALWGVPATITAKTHIYDPQEMFMLPPQQFFGAGFSLQEPTLFIKHEGAQIEFYVYSVFGIGIGNVSAPQQGIFSAA